MIDHLPRQSEPSPLSNSLIGAMLEVGMEMLKGVLVWVVAFGMGVAFLGVGAMREGARRWSQSSAWQRQREREEQRKAEK